MAEIKARKVEIRTLLEGDGQVNLEEINAELRSLEAEEKKIGQDLEKLEKVKDGTAQLRTIDRTGGLDWKEENAKRGIVTPDNATPAPTKRGKLYNELFFRSGEAPDKNHGFSSLGDFIRSVNSGRHDARLEQRLHLGGVGSLGGFSVPEEYGPWLFDTSLEQEIVRPRAAVWAMGSDTRKVPAWDGQDHSASLYGGFNGVWMDEAETATDQEAKVRELTLTARKLGIFVSVSNELLADSDMFEQQLIAAMGSALSYELDRSFLMGDGVAKPLGILNSPSIIELGRTGANAIAYADIIAMFARLHPSLHQGAVWICNHTALPQMLGMEDTAGHPVWHPDGAAGTPRTLLGREVIFTEKTPALGTRGDVILVNLKQYLIGMRKVIGLEKSNVPGWQRDASSFRAIVRVDGQPAWHEAVTPVSGDPLSWAVTLK